MKFIDEAIITIQSGNGGHGCVSLRREKFVPRGGPDGGNGGKGGDVVFVTTTHKRTLYRFRSQKHFPACNGSPGQGKDKTGKNGADLIIEIPPGTVLTDMDTGQTIKDFAEADQRAVIARGGRGGRGNAHFKSSTHRTPRFAQDGEPGEFLRLKLELKLLADVGIIGLPNAGKSTLITALSSARPKIADYPFTTLTPSLGVVHTNWGDPFVVADIPGLIAGAHKGVGLGFRFLRHIERTRILLHLVDVSDLDSDNPRRDVDTVQGELTLYDKALSRKPQLVVANKIDMPGAREAAGVLQAALGEVEILSISALSGEGLQRLTSKIIQTLEAHHDG